MIGIVDWAAKHARMILAFVLLSIAAGTLAYVGLPKEGEPDIDVPVLFVSVPFPGISAEDSEKLLVRPMETELRDIEGLDKMTGIAAEGYAAMSLEFEFGWDKAATLAEVRDRVSSAEAEFPEGFEPYSISEINFSEFPILVISLSGEVPERTLNRVIQDLQTDIEGLPPVLEASLAGFRNEMLEVLIDPLRLEAYNVTAGELLSVVVNNNQLIAAGTVESGSGEYSVKIPSAFDEPSDVYALPVKTNGDRVVTLGDLADIRLTFEDATGTARFGLEPTIALQIVKRKGANLIDTVAAVKAVVDQSTARWPDELQQALRISYSMDESSRVAAMVSQLEAAVLTAVALVMIVVLAALGTRSALLVGFAIPTSFLLCFALLAVFGITISNIVMFGLILAVGMLVDGAIVVVEYADKRIRDGVGPMRAYAAAAKRMFWPIVSSTATTLCAFLPMLFWPGVPGEFMGNLPVTLIFVLSASLVVALVYLPVVGGVSGRFSRTIGHLSDRLRAALPWIVRLLLVVLAAGALLVGVLGLVQASGIGVGVGPAAVLVVLGCVALSITVGAARRDDAGALPRAGYRRSAFGRFIHLIVAYPVMPFVTLAAAIGAMLLVFNLFQANNRGVEFFVEMEPERAIAYVRARGNLSVDEKDRLVRLAEEQIASVDGVRAIFAFAGPGGLNQNTGGADVPLDSIGSIQIELEPWGTRRSGEEILAEVTERLRSVPGVIPEILVLENGPASGKPIHLRLLGETWRDLEAATAAVRSQFEGTDGLIEIEDSLPLPGIDWQIDVDVEEAGRYGADVATVGAMVQLVTNGLLLDTMRTDTADEEIEIRVRFPEDQRSLSTLDSLRVRTDDGLVPLSNFITRQPVPKVGQITRFNTQRYFDVKANVAEGVNANVMIDEINRWLAEDDPLPSGVSFLWTGDREEQEESGAFLMQAFLGALGLMFVILLAQFNSVYNAVLVLLAVVMSVTGVMIGMMVMQQPFSIIMTGTGIVALAGIVVNNNIVLIDTYQEYARYMPRLEAIVRTAEARIRPVLLTTITTMAGLTPMMFGISVNFFEGGSTTDAPTALWWKQLATAVVFGLGVATFLTLLVTPALLAMRVWVVAFAKAIGTRTLFRSGHAMNRDRRLRSYARRLAAEDITWADVPSPPSAPPRILDAAE
ncbi:MAG: efflux RND transporter permease subunit [Pseudomonadota bacterium]